MNKPSKNPGPETVEKLKILGVIVGSAGLGALLTYGSADFFGYRVTLVAIVVVFFLGLAFEATVFDALVPTIVLGGLGYGTLRFFPQFMPVCGALCGIAIITAYAAYREEKER